MTIQEAITNNGELAYWLERWKLIPDGPPLATHTSQLLPVKIAADGMKAMLKITHDESERLGCALMAWWEGNGAARVIHHEKGAILLQRATGSASLSMLSRDGRDAEACRIMCRTANQLHRPRKKPLPQLEPLHDWFRPLKPAARTHGGILTRSADIADALLATPQDEVVLHGDLHHENVLDFGPSGWLAIDPKGIKGERGFDYANIFTNPDLSNPLPRTAVVPDIFKQRLEIVSEMAELDRERLLMWIIAWCGLSATWSLDINAPISIQCHVAELALVELDR